jgi:hypothetical protein
MDPRVVNELLSIGVPEIYIGRLVEQEILGLQDVLLLTEQDMVGVLQLPIGIKNRILQL